MEARGVTKKIDSLGRVTIPIEFRREYDLMIDDLVEIIPTDEGLLIKSHVMRCGVCGGTDDVEEHRNGLICADCRRFFRHLGPD